MADLLRTTEPAKRKRRPFYRAYDFAGDYFGSEARGPIADFIESTGQKDMAQRYRVCRQSILLLQCREKESSSCETKKYPDPYGDETERRGYYISRSKCRSRVCEPCARNFGNQFRKKIRPFIDALGISDKRYGFKHLTLTFKRSTDPITPAWIAGAMKKAARLVRKFYHQKNKAGEFKSGALAVMEMSPDGFFHLHCLVYGPWVNIKNLSQAWLKITGDSYRVDISDAQGRSKRYPNMTPRQALNEVTKYIRKPVSTPFLEEMFQYITAIKGRRRIHTWGIFYNHPNLKPDRNRLRCPFCGSSVVLIAEYGPDEVDDIDDGSYWPTWAVADGLRCGHLPIRYD